LQHSVDLYGLAPGTAYNLGVCCYGLRQMDQALDYINQALNLEPQFAEAQKLREELESEFPRAAREPRKRRVG